MLKLLRRYNKMILVIGGVVLMVVFLLPQAIHQFGPNPMSVVHFRADGRAYRGRDVYQAGKELQNLQAIEQMVYQKTRIPVPIYPPVKDATHWLLLVRVASDLGLIGGPQGGRDYLDELASLTAQSRFIYSQQNDQTEAQKKQLTDSLAEALKAGRAKVIDGGTPADMIDKTLAKLRAVHRLINLSRSLPSLSTREAAWFGREFLDTAVADVIVIGVKDYEPKVPEPTEQELMAHFEKYKSADPADNEYGIGYLRPPAVRVETLQIDRSVIRNAIQLDPIEVNKLWRQNQDKYGSSFQTARPNVEAALRTQKVQEIMSKVEELLRREFFKATNNLETLEGGYKKLPPDWAQRRPNYDVLAERVNSLIADYVQVGNDTQPATVIPADAWLDKPALAKHPAAAAAGTVGGQRVTFPQLALSVRTLDPTSKTGVQTGVTFGPIEIPQYKMFYFRVVEARPQSPPDSLDEIRDTVREDYVRLQAYDDLLADRDSIRQQIISADGYKDLYDRFPNDITVREDMTITSDHVAPAAGGSPLPVADKPELREAVAKLIESWDPKKVADDIPREDRIVVTPLPEAVSVAFVVVKGHHPMTLEELRRNDYRVLRAAQSQWSDPNAGSPFSYDALKERLHYVAARGQQDKDSKDQKSQQDPNTLN